MKKRADATVVNIHALHIVNIGGRENRQKAISIFGDVYDDNSTTRLKQRIEELWPTRKPRK